MKLKVSKTDFLPDYEKQLNLDIPFYPISREYQTTLSFPAAGPKSRELQRSWRHRSAHDEAMALGKVSVKVAKAKALLARNYF